MCVWNLHGAETFGETVARGFALCHQPCFAWQFNRIILRYCHRRGTFYGHFFPNSFVQKKNQLYYLCVWVLSAIHGKQHIRPYYSLLLMQLLLLSLTHHTQSHYENSLTFCRVHLFFLRINLYIYVSLTHRQRSKRSTSPSPIVEKRKRKQTHTKRYRENHFWRKHRFLFSLERLSETWALTRLRLFRLNVCTQ